MIAGLIKADKGDIFLADENVSSFAMHKRSKMGIKYLPQEPSIFQNLSVYENLLGLAELSFQRKEDIENFITKSIEQIVPWITCAVHPDGLKPVSTGPRRVPSVG